MPGCDWTCWGLLTNQNHARGYVEVCGGVHGGMQRYTEGCMEVCRGAWRGVQRYMKVH